MGVQQGKIELTPVKGSSSVLQVCRDVDLKIQARNHAMTEKINRLDVSPVTSEVQPSQELSKLTTQNATTHQTRNGVVPARDIAASIDDFEAERLDLP